MNRWVKRIGIGVLGLVVLIGVLAGTGFTVTNKHIKKTYDIKAEAFTAPSDSATLARGEHFTRPIGKCVDCHGDKLGGQILVDDPKFARLASPNLTRGEGGVAKNYKSDADWERAIRHGVRPDGTPVIFMPSNEYNNLTDEDVAAIIAYIKSMPPVNNVLPTPKMGPIAVGLYMGKILPLLPAESIDQEKKHVASFPAEVSAKYGEYMVNVGGCRGCHKANLGGGPDPAGPPGAPEPANLTPGGDLKNWSEADFITALRTGKRPDGRILDAFMPWRMTAGMTDDEIKAVWAYLQTVPAVETPKKK